MSPQDAVRRLHTQYQSGRITRKDLAFELGRVYAETRNPEAHAAIRRLLQMVEREQVAS